MTQISRFFRYFFWLFLCSPVLLSAQTTSSTTVSPMEASANTTNATVSLSPVVVTANRLDVPASQVTGSLTVLTSRDLGQKQDSTVMDALAGTPGLTVNRDGTPGQNTSLYIRGANDDAGLILLDGIPLNDPIGVSRSYDFLDNLSLDGVRQIEVLRGPQGALYGSSAQSGVINIITQDGQGPLGGSLLEEFGSYGTFRNQVSAQGADAGGDFLFSASHFNTDGFPAADKAAGDTLNNPDSDTTGLLKIGTAPVSNLSTDFLARYSQSHTNLLQYAGPGGVDPNYFADQKQLALGSQTHLTLGDWEQVLGLSFADDNRIYTDKFDAAYPSSSDRSGNYDGQMAKASWQNNLRLAPEETVIVGLEGYKEWGYVNDAAYFDAVSANAEMGSAFISSQTNLENRLFLNLGVRGDAHNQFGTHATYQAGAAYFVPGPETKLSANVGTGFEAPNLYQLYDPSYGNRALQPETTTGFDFGLEQPLGIIRVGATFFHADYTNLFGSDPLTFQYINVASARTQGLESFVALEGVKNLDLKLTYSYLDSRDLSTSANDLDAGLPLIRRPAHQGTLDANYDFGGFQVGSTLRYVGTRLDEDFNSFPASVVTMPSYFLVDLRAAVELDKQWKLFGRVENLFDQSYEQLFGYNTPGLSAYGGVKVSL